MNSSIRAERISPQGKRLFRLLITAVSLTIPAPAWGQCSSWMMRFQDAIERASGDRRIIGKIYYQNKTPVVPLDVHIMAVGKGTKFDYRTSNGAFDFTLSQDDPSQPKYNFDLSAWAPISDDERAKLGLKPDVQVLTSGTHVSGDKYCVEIPFPHLDLKQPPMAGPVKGNSRPASPAAQPSGPDPNHAFNHRPFLWLASFPQTPPPGNDANRVIIASFVLEDETGRKLNNGFVLTLRGEPVSQPLQLLTGRAEFQAFAEGFDPAVFAVTSSSRLITVASSVETAQARQVADGIFEIPVRLKRAQAERPDMQVSQTSGGSSFSIPAEYAEALPLSGWRSPDTLALLLPGVSPPPVAIGRQVSGIAPGIGTAGGFSVNGLRGRDNSFMDDGADNNDEDLGVRRRGILTPFPQPVESLSEFTVATGPVDVTYGRGIAGFADALTRTGAGEFHGSMWGFGTAGPLKAADFLSVSNSAYPVGIPRQQVTITANGLENGTPVPFITAGSTIPLPFEFNSLGNAYQSNPTAQKQEFLRAQSGFVLTGPLPGDQYRTTFTLSYERRTQRQSEQENFAVATPVERQVCGPTQSQCTGFLNSSINSNAVDYYASSFRGDALWSLIPFPNNPLGQFGGNTFTETLPADGNANVYVGQIARNFRTGRWNHAVSLRYDGTNESGTLPETDGAIFSAVKPVELTNNAALLFSSSHGSWMNLARVSFGNTNLHFDELRDPYLSPPSQPTRLPAGTPFLLNEPLLLNQGIGPSSTPSYTVAASTQGQKALGSPALCTEVAAGSMCPPIWADQVDIASLGQLSVAGFSPVGASVNYFPQKRSNNTWQWADTVTKSAPGGNAFTFGFDIRRVSLNSMQINLRPSADYHGLEDYACANSACTATSAPVALSPATEVSLAEAAATETFAIVQPGQNPNYDLQLRTLQAEGFVQDEINIGKRVHLVGGVRVQYSALPSDPGFSQAIALGNSLYDQVTNPATGGIPGLAPILKELLPASLQSALNSKPFSLDPRFGFAARLSADGSTVLRGGVGQYTGQFPAIIAEAARNTFPSFMTFSGGIDTTYANLLENQVGANQGVITTTNLPQVLERLSTTDTSNSILLNLTFPNSPRNPSAIQQSLMLDRKFGADGVFSIAYVGTEGRHLLMLSTPLGGLSRSFQITCVTSINNTPNLPFGVGGCYNGFVEQPVNGSNLILGTELIRSGASSTYHSLQASVAKRISSHLRVFSAFTWSHAIDNASDYAAVAGAFALPQNSVDPSEKGSSNFDVRLRSVTHFIAESPHDASPWLRDWLLSGILTFQSAQPYTINTSIDVNEDGNATDRLNNTRCLTTGTSSSILLQAQNPAACVATPLPDPPCPDYSGVRPTAGCIPGSAIGPSGMIGRNTFRGWPLYDTDVALARSFPLRERRSFQLRAEVYNLANHPNYGIPGRIIESPMFGKAVTAVVPPRTIQIALSFGF